MRLRPADSSPASAWPVAALAAGWGAVAVLAWWALAEPWELLADGDHYLAAARGGVAEPPFAYRLLGPWLAAALAEATGAGLVGAYRGLTAVALVASTALFALVGVRQGGPRRAGLVALLWTGSFAVAYSASIGVAADALYLVFVVAMVWLAGIGRGWGLVPAVAFGVLAHEMALFGLLALGVDRWLGSSAVLGGRRPGWGVLAAAGGAGALVLAASHGLTPVAAASIPNWTGTSPLRLAGWAVEYAGGPVQYGARVFAAYGPVALMALGALARRPARDRVAAVGLVAAAVALSFLATDTLRVMAMASVVVLPLAAAFLDRLVRVGRGRRAWAFVALQAVYSGVVYGHLRSFEGSAAFQGVAAAVSVGAAALVVWEVYVGRAAARTGDAHAAPRDDRAGLDFDASGLSVG